MHASMTVRFAVVGFAVSTKPSALPAARRAFSATRRSRKADHKGLKKVYASADEAVADIKSGDVLLSAGFGLCGTADTLLKAISRRKDVQGLTGVSKCVAESVFTLTWQQRRR